MNDWRERVRTHCANCGGPIRMMCQQGEAFCCINCQDTWTERWTAGASGLVIV